jgi:hypothetical protein
VALSIPKPCYDRINAAGRWLPPPVRREFLRALEHELRGRIGVGEIDRAISRVFRVFYFGHAPMQTGVERPHLRSVEREPSRTSRRGGTPA